MNNITLSRFPQPHWVVSVYAKTILCAIAAANYPEDVAIDSIALAMNSQVPHKVFKQTNGYKGIYIIIIRK